MQAHAWRRTENRSMRHTFAAVALTASLLTSALNPSTLLDSLWSFVTSLWSAPAQSDAGCGMDPNGLCAPKLQSDVGCGMDPDGRCISSLQ
jgi:hypothetical protein